MTSPNMTQVQLPMWVIDEIRADNSLTSATWAVIESCVRNPVKIDMRSVMAAVESIPGMPMLTSNQCAQLAERLNAS